MHPIYENINWQQFITILKSYLYCKTRDLVACKHLSGIKDEFIQYNHYFDSVITSVYVSTNQLKMLIDVLSYEKANFNKYGFPQPGDFSNSYRNQLNGMLDKIEPVFADSVVSDIIHDKNYDISKLAPHIDSWKNRLRVWLNIRKTLETTLIGVNDRVKVRIAKILDEIKVYLNSDYDIGHPGWTVGSPNAFRKVLDNIKANCSRGFLITEGFRSLEDFKKITDASREFINSVHSQIHNRPSNQEQEIPMSEQQTFTVTKQHSLTLPKDAIYEYLGEETLDLSKVKRDPRGNFIDLDKAIVKKRTGVLLAWPDLERKCIMVGFSRCAPTDTFNEHDGFTEAMKCAEYGFEHAGFPAKKTKSIRNHLDVFLTRCRSYYQQLSLRDWCVSYCANHAVVEESIPEGAKEFVEALMAMRDPVGVHHYKCPCKK